MERSTTLLYLEIPTVFHVSMAKPTPPRIWLAKLTMLFTFWKNLASNPYPSQWASSTSQNPNWSQNLQHPMGMKNLPMGMGYQPQPTLRGPLQNP